MKQLLVFIFILPFSCLALIEYVAKDFKESNYREFCAVMGVSEVLVPNAVSLTKVDCMGKIFAVNDFCQLKYKKSQTLVRGFVDSKEKKVYCQFAKKASLKVDCLERKELCRFHAKKQCESLKNIYAVSHELFRGFYDEKKFLYCFYTGEDLLDGKNF